MTKKPVSLRELIYWVKEELLSELARQQDPVPLFAVDEVTVEVNFVVDGTLQGGFDIKVVQASSEVSEQRVQKAVVKLSPVLDRQAIIDELAASNPGILDTVKSRSAKALLKGGSGGPGEAPDR